MNKAILKTISVWFFCTFPKPDSPECWDQPSLASPSAWPSDNWLIETTGQQGPSGLICPLGPGPSETQDVSVCTQEKIQEDLHHMANSI